jgi:sirohydrochlorin cobaltochelatase
MQSKAIVFLAHGSRDPLWQAPMLAIAARARALAPAAQVRLAYLELCAPDLPAVVAELVAAGTSHLTVMPLFLGMGRHAREDLPEIMQGLQTHHPAVHFDLLPPLGEDPRLVELAAALATTHATNLATLPASSPHS